MSEENVPATEVLAVEAYSLSALGSKLLLKLKKVAHPLAMEMYAGTKEWLQESADLSKTKLDDAVVVAIPYLDAIVKAQIDKLKV